jgi:LmbE family N-acetylglucosaminyl deacetylase
MMFERILAIGAHFDDIEIGVGGSLTKFVNQGKHVYGLVLTDSAYDTFNGVQVRSEATALKEGQDAAKIIGYDLITFDYKAKELPFNVELIEKINKIIEDYNIDTIFTHWPYDIHQDHIAASRATLTAGRHVKNILFYRSNWYDTDQTFNGKFNIDISDEIETKKLAIKAHVNEYNKFGDGWLQFFISENKNIGKKYNIDYAEQFELVKCVL